MIRREKEMHLLEAAEHTSLLIHTKWGLYAILLKLYCDSELKKNSKCIIFNINLEAVVTMFIFNY